MGVSSAVAPFNAITNCILPENYYNIFINYAYMSFGMLIIGYIMSQIISPGIY